MSEDIPSVDQFQQLKEETKTYGSSIELYTIGSLLDRKIEPPSFLVESLLIQGGSSILGGKPKSGKSTTAQDIAYCVAHGEFCFGAYQVKEGVVIYLALEEMLANVVENFRRRGVTRSSKILIQCGLRDFINVADLERAIRAEQAILCILDHFTLGFPVKEINDYIEITRIFAPITQLARRTGCHVMVLHHTNKNKTGADSILGSTALTGAVDNVLVMSEMQGQRYLMTRQRIGQDLPDTPIEMNLATRTISLKNPGEGRYEDSRDQQTKSLLLQALRESNRTLDRTELFSKVHRRKDKLLEALPLLEEDPSVEILGKGIKGDPRLYRWKEDSGSQTPLPKDGSREPEMITDREVRDLAKKQPEEFSSSCYDDVYESDDSTPPHPTDSDYQPFGEEGFGGEHE